MMDLFVSNKSECFDLISAHDEGEYNRQHYTQLRENILNSHVFPVNEEESRIVEEFTT